MNLTDEHRTEIQAAVIDMSITDWGLSDEELESYAGRVTWWLENRDHLQDES